MNKALFRFAGILKASPLKYTTSDNHNTQEHLSREQQMLWKTDGRFGVSWCRGGLVDWIGAWWSWADHYVPTPLTTRVEGKCKSHLWPLRMGACANTSERVLFFTLLAVAVRRCQDTTRAFSPFTSRGNRLLIAITSTSTFIFRHSFYPIFICHHSKLQLLDSTWFGDYLVYGGARFRAVQCSRGCVRYFRAYKAWPKWEVD